MSGHSHAKQPGGTPESEASIATQVADSVQDFVGNSALLGSLFGGDGAQATEPGCAHAHGKAAPRPETGDGVDSASLVGGAIGGLLFGPVGAIVGAKLGPTLAQEVDEAFSDTGLGSDVDTLLESSPALQGAFDGALEKGWTIQYGTAGEGTFADPASNTVVIDPNDRSDQGTLAQSLAHELGHVNYELEPELAMEGLSEEEYVRGNTQRHLRDEAEATMLELEVREELMAGDDGFDMGISGATGPEKIALYEQYQNGDITREAMVEGVANLFGTREETSTDGQNYYDYYSEDYQDRWDAAHP